MRPVLLLLLVAGAACGPRQQHAYHFRSPLLGSVRAPELPPVEPDQEPAARPPAPIGRPATRLATGLPPRPAGPPGAAAEPAPPAWRPPERRSIPGDWLAGARGEELAGRLRALVGGRDETSSHLGFALAALRALGAGIDPELAGVDDGAALVALAERRGALVPAAPGAPLPTLRVGDLLVFDRVVASDPASLVALVVSTDERGVVEMVYLARAVVRRGFVQPAEPHARRDAGGRVLNTFLRHSDGADPRGTPSLAGELIAAVVPLDRLLR